MLNKPTLKSRALSLLLPSIVTVVLVLAVYIIKGITPFGPMHIAYADMAQGYIGSYSYLWDVFHAGKSVFWDFSLGAGSNMFGSFALNALFFPLSWLGIFFPRDGMLTFFSISLVLHLALIAFTTNLFLHKVFPESRFFLKVIFALSYTFCGYMLLYYTNIMWLDLVAIFPLLVLSLKSLYEEGKVAWFILWLTLGLICSIYISLMILFFLVITSIIAVFYFAPKGLRADRVSKLLLATGISALLSCIVVLPAYGQISGSARLADTGAEDIVLFGPITNKMALFLFSSLVLVGFIALLFNWKKDKKWTSFFFISVVVLGCGLVFERINMQWHNGSYNGFTMRFAFIPLFFLMLAAMYYMSRRHNDVCEERPKTWLVVVYALLFVAATALAVCFAGRINANEPALNFYAEDVAVLIGVTALFAGAIIAALRSGKLRDIMISLVVVTQIVLMSVWCVGVPQNEIDFSEQRSDNTEAVYPLLDELDMPEDDVYRYRDASNIFGTNYPLVLGRGSLSSWLHIISGEQLAAHGQLGYSTIYMRLVDAGGTAFSDAVLGVKHMFSLTELDSELFTKTGKSGDVYLYDYNASLPFGLVVSDTEEFIPEQYSDFDAQNYLYKSLFDKSGDILHLSSFKSGDTVSVAEYEGPVMLYFIGVDSIDPSHLPDEEQYKILVNGSAVSVPDLGNSENELYPARYNSAILPLGVYDEDVTLTLSGEGFKDDELRLAVLELSDYYALCEQYASQNSTAQFIKNKMYFSVDAGSGDTLFVPECYNSGWRCTVNGEAVEVARAYGTYMSVPLESGANEVVFTFIPSLFKEGAIITLVALLILLGVFLITKGRPVTFNKIVAIILAVVFWALFAFIAWRVYISSFIDFFKTLLM